MQEEIKKRQAAENERQKLAATLAKEKEQADRLRQQSSQQKQFAEQLRAIEEQARTVKMSELNALHDIAIAKKQKELDEERQKAQVQAQAMEAKFLQLQGKLGAKEVEHSSTPGEQCPSF